MNNFGVYELASAKVTSAPGWAYVPDTGVNPAAAALQPASRKRAARKGPNPSASDLTARQEAKIRKELEALDRDCGRDASIPVLAKGSGTTRGQTKSTPNVRKILQSQKTFHNHLDDYLALLAHAESAPAPHPNQHTAAKQQPANKPPHPNQHTKRNAAAAAAASAAASRQSAKRSKTSTPKPAEPPAADVDMTSTTPQSQSQSQSAATPPDAAAATTTGTASPTAGNESILAPYDKPLPPPHPGDDDPLLASCIPDMPTDEELRWLLAQPMLTYWDARATWGSGGGDEGADVNSGADVDVVARYPVRTFCEVCGYWGRVKCIKCGTRVCALDCLETHREDCFTRYGV